MSLLIAMMLIICLIPQNSLAVNNTDSIKSTINNYFDSYYDTLQNSDLNKGNKISPYFSDPNNNLYNKYEIGRLNFLIKANQVNNYKLETYKLELNFSDVSIENTTAKVEVVVTASTKYNFQQNADIINKNHIINMSNISGKWLIVSDEYNDELKELYGNFADLNSEIPKIKKNDTQTDNNITLVESSILRGVPGDYTVDYDSTRRSISVNYALSHTNNSGESSSQANYNTSQFKSYNPNDCQNFVSQCIWYGFGGRNSSTKDLPMDAYWWANTTSTASTNNWINVDSFKSYVTNNYSTSGYGIQGYTTTSESSISIGDYVYVPGHVMFVTETDGTFAGTKISAHTSNRLNISLASLYGSKPSNMVYVHILRFKWNDGGN